MDSRDEEESIFKGLLSHFYKIKILYFIINHKQPESSKNIFKVLKDTAINQEFYFCKTAFQTCLLYTSDAADDWLVV